MPRDNSVSSSNSKRERTVPFQGIDFEIPPGMQPGDEAGHTLNQLEAGASHWVEFRQVPPAVAAALSNGGRYFLTAGGLLFNEYGSYLGQLAFAMPPEGFEGGDA
jgi:hypothetical protein